MKTQIILATALTLATTVLADGPNCIHLKGDKSYTWHADGAFSGSGHIDDSTHCFGPGGGGISIGAPKASGMGMSGNTRLECYFPENDNPAGGDFYNCNLSLVDGFSAAVTCETSGGGWSGAKDSKKPLGCGYDLMANCPDSLKDPGCNCCKNPTGAKVGDLGGVDPAFQACKVSDEYPNTAELYFSMTGAYSFKKSDFPLTCTVGKGAKVPGSRKRDEHQHHARHEAAQHVRHVHARSLDSLFSK